MLAVRTERRPPHSHAVPGEVLQVLLWARLRGRDSMIAAVVPGKQTPVLAPCSQFNICVSIKLLWLFLSPHGQQVYPVSRELGNGMLGVDRARVLTQLWRLAAQLDRCRVSLIVSSESASVSSLCVLRSASLYHVLIASFLTYTPCR